MNAFKRWSMATFYMEKNPIIIPLSTLYKHFAVNPLCGVTKPLCVSFKKDELCHSIIWLKKNLLCTRQNVTHCNAQKRWSRSEVWFVCLFSFFAVWYWVSLGTVDEVDEKAKTSRFTVFDFYLSYRDMCSGCSKYWCYPFLVVAWNQPLTKPWILHLERPFRPFKSPSCSRYNGPCQIFTSIIQFCHQKAHLPPNYHGNNATDH